MLMVAVHILLFPQITDKSGCKAGNEKRNRGKPKGTPLKAEL